MTNAKIEMAGHADGDRLSESDLAGRDWVMRYQVPFIGEVERRPVSIVPDQEGLYFVDFGTPLRFGPSSAALYSNGKWLRTNKLPWKTPPTHWSKTLGLPVSG